MITLTLTGFLLARIAEDEAVALATRETRWESYPLPDPGPDRWTMTGVGIPDDDMGHRTETMFPADAEHIARHDPARVLAECEAKRRIVEALDKRRRREGLLTLTEESVLHILAAVYADDPDYRDEWRP